MCARGALLFARRHVSVSQGHLLPFMSTPESLFLLLLCLHTLPTRWLRCGYVKIGHHIGNRRINVVVVHVKTKSASGTPGDNPAKLNFQFSFAGLSVIIIGKDDRCIAAQLAS